MGPNEDPEDGMIREIKEELSIGGDIFLVEKEVSEVLQSSPSYPGLISQYTYYKYTALLNNEQFKPEGYIEEQEDKITYFTWHPANL